MKNVFTFLFVITALLFINWQSVRAQEYWNKYTINETFDGLTAVPWTVISGTTSPFGRSGNTACVDNALLFSGNSPSGNRGSEVSFGALEFSQDVFVEFDVKIDAATVGHKNALLIALLGSKSTNVNAGDGSAYADVIFGIYLAGGSGVFHYWNQDIQGPSPVDNPTAIVPAFATGQYPNFNRAGADVTIADSLNASTKTAVTYAVLSSYHIKAVLDFTGKVVKSMEITDKNNPENTQVIENKPFISSTVSDVAILDVMNTRSSSAGNGAAVDYSVAFDYLQIYEKVLSLGRDNVTVYYKDNEGGEAKPSVVHADQERGLEFKISNSDKTTFIDNGFYYAYDAATTGSESVLVTEGGVSITVYYKKSPVYNGVYTWTGATSSFWDELDNNFTTDGSNSVSYQQGNSVVFGEASNKEITILGNKNLSSGDLTVNAEGYSFTGDAILSGEGAVYINASSTIGVTNNLEGGVVLNQGTLEVKSAAAAKKYTVESGTALNINAATLSAPITGDGGELTIIPTYQVVATSAITGVETLNYRLQHRGNVDKPAMTISTYSGMPRLNNAISGVLNVTTELDSAFFGTTISYPNTKMHLGDNVYLVYSDNPANTAAGTAVTIGELSGTATSGVMGARLRRLDYRVGGLNTDAEFAGSIYNYPYDQWDGAIRLNIFKVGTGVWTLSGNSPDYAGAVVVENGTLQIDGNLGSEKTVYPGMTPGIPDKNPPKEPELLPSLTIEVADSASLSGTGYIGCANALIEGTLSGSLTFEGSTQLGEKSVTKIIVDGSTADVLTVNGDFYANGTLQIEVNGAPTTNQYTIMNAPSVIPEGGENGFAAINYPTGDWSFDIWSGILTYNGGYTSIEGVNIEKEVASKEYYDLLGKVIVADNYEGLVIEKVKYTDGSVATFKKLLQKK